MSLINLQNTYLYIISPFPNFWSIYFILFYMWERDYTAITTTKEAQSNMETISHMAWQSNSLSQQEAFEKCWAHSLLRASARRLFYIAIHQVSLLSHAATVACRLRIDVHNNINNDNNNNNDNAWQRGPLWPHRMGPITVAQFIMHNRDMQVNQNSSLYLCNQLS